MSRSHHTKHEMSEHDVQSVILGWLGAKHYLFWRNNTGATIAEYKGKARFIRFGKRGSPDIYVLREGKLFGIEVKAHSKGFQSQVQHEFEVEFTKAGGKYLLCFSLEDVIRGMNGV